jgi:uncharacterized protein with von Willebrand factor type A (vWA) domain
MSPSEDELDRLDREIAAAKVAEKLARAKWQRLIEQRRRIEVERENEALRAEVEALRNESHIVDRALERMQHHLNETHEQTSVEPESTETAAASVKAADQPTSNGLPPADATAGRTHRPPDSIAADATAGRIRPKRKPSNPPLPGRNSSALEGIS